MADLSPIHGSWTTTYTRAAKIALILQIMILRAPSYSINTTRQGGRDERQFDEMRNNGYITINNGNLNMIIDRDLLRNGYERPSNFGAIATCVAQNSGG